MCAVLNHPPAGAGEIRRSQKPHIQNRPRPSRPSAEPPPRPEEPEAPRYTRPQANYRKRDVYKAKDRRGLLAIIKFIIARLLLCQTALARLLLCQTAVFWGLYAPRLPIFLCFCQTAAVWEIGQSGNLKRVVGKAVPP